MPPLAWDWSKQNELMGREIVNLLFGRIAGKAPPSRSRFLFPPRLVIVGQPDAKQETNLLRIILSLKESKRMYRVNAGFTLIELLVVIAIIAIIAAIFFPVFDQGPREGASSDLPTNEKQIVCAFVQYTQDYDECAMLSNNADANWVKRVYPYIKSVAVFACPDDTSTKRIPRLSLLFPMRSTGNVVSLYGNYSPEPVLVSKINAPAGTVLRL